MDHLSASGQMLEFSTGECFRIESHSMTARNEARLVVVHARDVTGAVRTRVARVGEKASRKTRRLLGTGEAHHSVAVAI